MRKFGWIHNFDSLHTWLVADAICSAMPSMVWWWVKIFLLLFIIFRTNLGTSIIPSPYSLLFVFHLDRSLNLSTDKTIKYNLHICELVFHFSLRSKLNIFFSLVPFSLEMYRSRGKEITEKRLNVNRQFSKDLIWMFLFSLCNPIAGGTIPILKKNYHPFPPFPFINTPFSNEDFLYIQPTPFYYNPLPPRPRSFDKSHLVLKK